MSKLIELLTVALVLSAVKLEPSCLDRIVEYGVFKDLSLPVNQFEVAKIIYKNNELVKCGNNISDLFTVDQPKISNFGTKKDPNNLYALLMLNLDALILPPFLHWAVVNIKGNGLESGDVTSSYFSPVSIGNERYVFLVFNQSKNVDAGRIYSFNQRINFKVKPFMEFIGSSGLVTVNLFHGQPEVLND